MMTKPIFTAEDFKKGAGGCQAYLTGQWEAMAANARVQPLLLEENEKLHSALRLSTADELRLNEENGRLRALCQTMFDPENQPPQFSRKEAFEMYRKLVGE